ncbi:hypothetical protein ABKW28_19195 [Nocardioides sp. 31GB23]|uniref:hypothetical protein n=1 Tax=Nocardioides sp. 31GB23 TaxID=3156065 RepID=UPI0032AF16EA
MKVNDAHLSGRYTTSRTQLLDGVGKVLARRVGVAAVTEVRGRHDDLHRLDGVAVHLPATRTAADCAILVDTSIGAIADRGHAVLSRGHGKARSTIVLTWALIELDAGGTLLRAGFHAPASVQHGHGFSKLAADRGNVTAWQAALDELPRVLCDLIAEHQPDETVLSADWNVHLRLRSWRRLINQKLKPTGLRLVVPRRATIGRTRVIDAHATTMRRRRMSWALRVFDLFRGWDHRPVVARLKSRRKKRRK